MKLRACREAEKILNQYFVFAGKYSTRHVASSLLLAYVFSREPAAKKSGEAGEEAERTGAATLVAMLHSLSTRFAPDVEALRRTCRARAYEEIRRRDALLFEHLSAIFPGEGEVKSSGRIFLGDCKNLCRPPARLNSFDPWCGQRWVCIGVSTKNTCPSCHRKVNLVQQPAATSSSQKWRPLLARCIPTDLGVQDAVSP